MSNSRKFSRAAAKAKKAAPATGLPVRSLITLTEVPNTGGGFTLGLGLHGAHLAALDPTNEQQSTEVSSVDIAALALSYIVRTNPPAFQEAITLVQDTLKHAAKQIAEGMDADAAMARANTVLSGAEAPASDEPVNG
jgi:hypothetical protein